MEFILIDGATPLDEDEVAGLIPDHISTQGELNAWESQNIEKAYSWGLSGKKSNILTIEYCKNLHLRMFDTTWKWAGKFRQSDKNIGCAWFDIPTEIMKLLDDTKLWVNDSVYRLQEIAIRFHYRMVTIHPFSNGNGRHARLYADILLFNFDIPHIEWGAGSLDSASEMRNQYISALKAADKGNFGPLLGYIQ